MHADTLDRELQLVGGERLDLDLAESGAVERVGEVRAEPVDVEVLRAPADLFVHREPDAHGRARGGVPCEIGDGGDDLGDPGLVVCAEQRGAVARDDVVPHPRRQVRQLVRIEHLARIAGQPDRAARVRVVEDGRHTRAGSVRRRVHVRDETDRGGFLDRPGKGREHVAVLGELGVLEADRAELVDEEPRQVELLRGRRVPRVLHRRLRVDHDVPEESLEHLVRELGGEGAGVPRPVVPWSGLSQGTRASGTARRSSRALPRAPRPGSSRSASASAPSAG